MSAFLSKLDFIFQLDLINKIVYVFRLRYSLSYGTATSSDFTFQDSQNGGKLIFKPGEIMKSLSVNILSNTIPEMNETFHLIINSDDGVTDVPGNIPILILDDGEYSATSTFSFVFVKIINSS